MKSLYKEKEEYLYAIAYDICRNKFNQIPDEGDIDYEKARLERIMAEKYVNNKDDIHYEEFVIKFINENRYTLLYTNHYQDVEIKDPFNLNVNDLINKMINRGEQFPKVV